MVPQIPVFIVQHSGHFQSARISTVLSPALHYPGSDNFTIWDVKQQEAHPACRVGPSNATDVFKTLNILVDY